MKKTNVSNYKQLAQQINNLSEEDKHKFDHETFNHASFYLGIRTGKMTAIQSAIIDLIQETEDMDVLNEIVNDVVNMFEQLIKTLLKEKKHQKMVLYFPSKRWQSMQNIGDSKLYDVKFVPQKEQKG